MRHHAASSLFAVLLAACAAETTRPGPEPAGGGGFPAAQGGSGGETVCDEDGDGHDGLSCGGEDCDDAAATVHPGADEACDAVDADCDGDLTEGCDCTPGDAERCWTGEDATRGVGACSDGVRRCAADGTWGACEGQVLPADEGTSCDGVDQDCDGKPDPASCTGCAEGAVEVCGNGLDDDCNQEIDDAAICTLECAEVNPRQAPPGLSCCGSSPPAAYSSSCVEFSDFPACTSAERACLDLDGDPATTCTKKCTGESCTCGTQNDAGQIVATPGCGFLTPCARVACSGENQPCYSGPPSTLGRGICHGGRHSCEDGRWSSCEDEQLPQVEICGNGIDENCDGSIDEVDGATGRACARASACPPGAREICGNGTDDDCDGFADEACPAAAGATQACWTGDMSSRNQGACRDGEQRESAGVWGDCVGEVRPDPERCGDGVDSDCNGLGAAGAEEDRSCCVPGTEICNGVDDDCDGLADEGVVSRCGTCGTECFAEEPAELSDCTAPGRTCERISPVDLFPAAITLSANAPLPPGSHVLAFTEGGSSLVLMDTVRTTTRTLPLPFTAGRVLMAPDGTFWVAKADLANAKFLHMDDAGNVLCTAEPGAAASSTVDSDGNLWVITGGFTNIQLVKYSGKDTYRDVDGVRRCTLVDLTPDDEGAGLTVTGICPPAEDANHNLWVVGSQLQRVDLRSVPRVDTFELASNVNFNQTMIGSEGALYGNEWFTRIDLPPSENAGKLKVYLDPWVFIPMYDGTAWVWIWPNTTPDSLAQLDLATGDELRRISIPRIGSNSGYGLALDSVGSLWTKHGDELDRFVLATGEWDRFPRSADVAMWPTSTDRPLRELFRRRGRWTQVVDPGGFDVIWRQLSWDALVPGDGRVLVWVRFADDPSGFDASDVVCGPFERSPVSLTGCGGRRYARIELELTGYSPPAVDRVKLTWDRR